MFHLQMYSVYTEVALKGHRYKKVLQVNIIERKKRDIEGCAEVSLNSITVTDSTINAAL